MKYRLFAVKVLLIDCFACLASKMNLLLFGRHDSSGFLFHYASAFPHTRKAWPCRRTWRSRQYRSRPTWLFHLTSLIYAHSTCTAPPMSSFFTLILHWTLSLSAQARHRGRVRCAKGSHALKIVLRAFACASGTSRIANSVKKIQQRHSTSSRIKLWKCQKTIFFL